MFILVVYAAWDIYLSTVNIFLPLLVGLNVAISFAPLKHNLSFPLTVPSSAVIVLGF